MATELMDCPDDGLSTGNETILLVDDEQVIIDVARDMLEILGYRAIVAQDGQQAIDIYNSKKDEIALVILDMDMPGLSGADVFQVLKAINSKVKVILASGYIMSRQIAAVMEQGCRAFMSKPYRMEELAEKIRTIIDKA